jgi:hypothetical protein
VRRSCPGSDLLPERLAWACAEVLPVDGAGISLCASSDRRLPLGASDPASAEAERLQFTVGEVPCLTSHATGDIVIAGAATMRIRWPGYYDTRVTHTPIRGTISLPLRDELHGIGALDLYVVPPREVGAGPAWLDASAAERRSAVWQAIGFVNSALGVPSPDALALLRAHAHADGQSLDDLAAQVLSRQVPVEDLALDSDSPR